MEPTNDPTRRDPASPPVPTDEPPTAPIEPNSNRLTFWIVVAIVAAIAMALLLPRWAVSLEVGGEVFLRVLKMVVVPLVMASVMSGILGLGDIRKLGRPGLYTVAFYGLSTLLAVVVGLVVVNAIEPGVGAFQAGEVETMKAEGRQAAGRVGGQVGEENLGFLTIARNLILMLFTDNLFDSMARTDLLPLIVFSIAFAAMLTTMGARAETISKLILGLNDALLTFVILLMNLAPVGIFCLVAARFGRAQLEGAFLQELGRVGSYVAAVLTGLAMHALVLLPLILYLFTRRNPFRFIGQMSQAILTAFATASSTATLPVTLEGAEKNARISRRATEFVIPLGATINMNGTALYEAVAVLFIAQALGIELSFLQQITVAITATLAAIGAAGIPEAGLVTMVIVLNAVGLPISGIGLILSVDWFLDRFRTAVNVFGDAVGAAVVERSFPES